MKKIFNFIQHKLVQKHRKKDHMAVIRHAKERYEWLRGQGKADDIGYIVFVYDVDTEELRWQSHKRK